MNQVQLNQTDMTMNSPASSTAAFAWMALSSVLFAFMNLFAHLASLHAHWSLVASVRATMGTVIAFGVARARKAPLIVRNRQGIWLRSIFGTASMLCTFYALGSTEVDLGDVVTLLNLSPIFVALMAPYVLGERAGLRVGIALPLSLAGAVLVLRPSFLFASGGHVLSPEGVIASWSAILSALLSSFAMMLLRRIGPSESPEAIALHFSVTASISLWLLAFVLGTAQSALLMPLPTIWAMIGAGICAGFAQLAMTRAYSLEGAARVSGLSYLSLVCTALLGAAALHQVPQALSIFGMILVIAGGLVLTAASMLDEKRRGRRS